MDILLYLFKDVWRWIVENELFKDYVMVDGRDRVGYERYLNYCKEFVGVEGFNCFLEGYYRFIV